jgi:hypothetical protein
MNASEVALIDTTSSRNFTDRLVVVAFLAAIVGFLMLMAFSQMPPTTFQGPPTVTVPVHHVVPKAPPSGRTTGSTPGPTIVQAPGGNPGSPV